MVFRRFGIGASKVNQDHQNAGQRPPACHPRNVLVHARACRQKDRFLTLRDTSKHNQPVAKSLVSCKVSKDVTSDSTRPDKSITFVARRLRCRLVSSLYTPSAAPIGVGLLCDLISPGTGGQSAQHPASHSMEQVPARAKATNLPDMSRACRVGKRQDR